METWTVRTPSHIRWAVVALRGELDLRAVRELHEPLRTLVHDHGPWLALDLSRLTFIDTTGVGLLVRLGHSLREKDGELALVAPRGQVRRVLRWTNVIHLFPVFDSVADVLAEPPPR